MNFVTVALDCCIEVATPVEKVFQKVIIDEVVRDKYCWMWSIYHHTVSALGT